MFRKILKSLAVATAITISLAGTALSAEPDLDEFRDETSEGIVQLDDLEGKVSAIPAAEAGTNVHLTFTVNNPEYSTDPSEPFAVSEGTPDGQGNYEIVAEKPVEITAFPKPGYYAYIETTSNDNSNVYESACNHVLRKFDKSDIYIITITFLPIKATTVTIRHNLNNDSPNPVLTHGSVNLVDFPGSYGICGSDRKSVMDFNGSATADSIPDRAEKLEIIPTDGTDAVKDRTVKMLRGNASDAKDLESEGDWEEILTMLTENNVTEIGAAELIYTPGYSYTFTDTSGKSGWRSKSITVYPGDTLSANDFIDGQYSGILKRETGGVILPAAEGTGYTGKWQSTGNAAEEDGFDRLLAGEVTMAEVPEENRSYEIAWTANTYKLTFDCQGGTVNIPNNGDWAVTFDTEYGQLPEPEKTGYDFQGWYDDTEKLIADNTPMKTAKNHTLYAGWKLHEYKVTYDPDDNSISPAKGIEVLLQDKYAKYTVESGFTLPTLTRTGYTFNGWQADRTYTGVTTDGNGIVTKITPGVGDGQAHSNLSFTASWTANTYTITLKGTNAKFEDGSTTKQYTIEDEITLPQPTRSGYTFTGWTGTGLNAASTVVTIEKSIGDRTYTATWRGQEYTINIYPNYGSNRVPDTNDDHTPYLVTHPSYKYLNSKQMLSEFPGYKFLIWKVRAANDTTGIKYSDADGTEYKDFKQVRSSLDSSTNTIPDLNIYAVWTPNTLTARPTLTPSDGGTCTDANGNTVSPTTGYTLTYGTNQALTFKASKGYKIAKITITATAADGQTDTKEISVNGESYSFKYSDTSYPDGAQLLIAATFTDANPYSAEEYGWSFTNMQRAFWDSSTYAFPESRYAEVFGDGSGSSYYKAAVKNGTNKWGGSCAGMSLTSALFYTGKLNWDSYRTGYTKPNDFHDGLEKYGSSYIVKADRSNSADNPNDVRRLIEDYQIYGNTALTQGTDDDLIKNYYSYQINYSAGTLKYAHRSAGTYVSDTLDILRNAKDPMPIVFYGQYNDTGRTFGHMIVARTDIKPEDPDGDGWWNVYVYDPNYPVVDKEIIKKANQMAGGTDIGAGRINPAKNVTPEDGKGRFMELNPSQNKWRYESSANATTGAGFIGCDKSGNVEYMDYTSGSWKVSCPDYYALRFLDGSTFIGDFRDRAYVGSPWMAEEGEAYVTVDGSVDCTIYDSDGKAVAIASDGNGMALTEDAVFTPYVGETAEDGGMAGGRFVLDGERFTVAVTEPGEVQFFGNDKVITAIPGGGCGLEADLATNTVSATASGESMDIRLKTANVYSSTSAAYALAEGTLGSGETVMASLDSSDRPTVVADSDFTVTVEGRDDDRGVAYTPERRFEDGRKTGGENDTHTVSIETVGHGHVSADRALLVPDGGMVLLFITPDAGSHTENVYIDGKNIGAPDCYRLTDIRSDTVVKAVFTSGDGTVSKNSLKTEEFEKGGHKYKIVYSASVPYTGKKHVVEGTAVNTKKKDADIHVEVTVDGEKAEALKLKYKRNKKRGTGYFRIVGKGKDLKRAFKGKKFRFEIG